MNPSHKDQCKTNPETKAFDPPVIHEEEILHPRPDNDDETAGRSEPAEVGEDKETTAVITKEAMLRVSGGQL